MTFEEFSNSLRDESAPAGMRPPLEALWLDAKGDWQGAHGIAQDIETSVGSLIHAYLHRKEGDLDNARYWYRHAGRAPVTGPLDHEWAALVQEMLKL
jgi:hypothetical protein